MKLPINLFQRIARKYKIRYRKDLIQDMSLLYLESCEEKQTLKYVNSVYPLRCRGFIKLYNNPMTLLLDDEVPTEEGEILTYSDLLECKEDLESNIINNDMINNLNLTPEEKLIQKLFYFDGYSVKEIIEYYAQETFITSEKTIYKILKKGQ